MYEERVKIRNILPHLKNFRSGLLVLPLPFVDLNLFGDDLVGRGEQ